MRTWSMLLNSARAKFHYASGRSGFVPVLCLPPGVAIDVYTQRDGKGINQSSDTFAPGELVAVTAYLTYNLAPIAGNLVTFNLYLPNGTMLLSRVSETDEKGLAFIAYLVPAASVFGMYKIKATAVTGEESVSDFLSFRISWLVEVADVIPSDRHGLPKNDFKKGEPLYLAIYVQNNRLNPTYATVCCSVLDVLEQFLLFSSGNYLVPPNQTEILMNVGPIPFQAYSGTATAYTFAAQWLGEPAFSPEVPAPFMIISPCPDVAVVGLTATPIDTYVGNSVKITVAVLNDCHLPQSFNVTIYCNSNVLQTLTIVNLDPYTEKNFTYIWDTYTFSQGNYIIKAYAWPVPGETNTADNTYVGGTVHITQRVSPVHDVAITRGEQSKDVVGVGYSCPITITAQNQGDYAETFDVSIYANQTFIGTFVNVTLASGNSTTFTFKWNTLGSVKGNYIIWACAWPVLGETDTLDNNSTSGWMVVTIPGDVNGDFRCEGKDIAIIAKAYGIRMGEPGYVPNADINDDGKIDGKDIAVAAKNFGQRDP